MVLFTLGFLSVVVRVVGFIVPNHLLLKEQ